MTDMEMNQNIPMPAAPETTAAQVAPVKKERNETPEELQRWKDKARGVTAGSEYNGATEQAVNYFRRELIRTGDYPRSLEEANQLVERHQSEMAAREKTPMGRLGKFLFGQPGYGSSPRDRG